MNQATMKYTCKSFGPPARARRSDPIQSDIAADTMNSTGQTQYERIRVLRALRLHGRSTAKRLDTIMPIAEDKWDGWAHRRMKELEDMGLVERTKTGREKVCSLTESGKKLIGD